VSSRTKSSIRLHSDGWSVRSACKRSRITCDLEILRPWAAPAISAKAVSDSLTVTVFTGPNILRLWQTGNTELPHNTRVRLRVITPSFFRRTKTPLPFPAEAPAFTHILRQGAFLGASEENLE